MLVTVKVQLKTETLGAGGWIVNICYGARLGNRGHVWDSLRESREEAHGPL